MSPKLTTLGKGCPADLKSYAVFIPFFEGGASMAGPFFPSSKAALRWLSRQVERGEFSRAATAGFEIKELVLQLSLDEEGLHFNGSIESGELPEPHPLYKDQ
jgi:hypothetical protein